MSKGETEATGLSLFGVRSMFLWGDRPVETVGGVEVSFCGLTRAWAPSWISDTRGISRLIVAPMAKARICMGPEQMTW